MTHNELDGIFVDFLSHIALLGPFLSYWSFTCSLCVCVYGGQGWRLTEVGLGVWLPRIPVVCLFVARLR